MSQPPSARRRRRADRSQSVQVFVDASGRRRRAWRNTGLVLVGVLLLFLVALVDPLFTSHASGPPEPPVSVVPAGGTM